MSNSFHATATKERQGARNDKRSSPYYLSRKTTRMKIPYYLIK